MKKGTRLALQILLPVLVLSCALSMAAGLVMTRPRADREESHDEGPLVDVQAMAARRHDVAVEAHGVVVAAQQLALKAQVGGRVVWLSGELVPGGRFRMGDPILRIDPRDYRLALEAHRAEVDRTGLEVEVEQGRQAVAEREIELFAGSGEQEIQPTGLARREPQLRTAKVAANAARSALRRAQLDLGRTTLVAPWNAMVKDEVIDLGQVVAPQADLATLVGTDRFWVQVSVPVEALSAIDVPRSSEEPGSRAVIEHDVGSAHVERAGRVIRMLPDLDPAGRMARLLVEIDDPLGLAGEAEEQVPLLIGSYVRVSIEARPIDNAIEVPRAALRDGDRVFVVADGDRLTRREVSIVWRRRDSVIVTRGLSAGDRVVLTRLGAPVEGMRVRIAPHQAAAEGGRAEVPR